MQRWLFVAWTFFAHASGIAVISIATGFFLVYLFSRDAPVVEAVGPFQPKNPVLGPGDTLIYTGALRRNESCSGDFILTFLHKTATGTDVMVLLRRKLPAAELTQFAERTRHLELPESVFPGKWEVHVAVESRCPTRQRIDELAVFDIEVTPK